MTSSKERVLPWEADRLGKVQRMRQGEWENLRQRKLEMFKKQAWGRKCCVA